MNSPDKETTVSAKIAFPPPPARDSPDILGKGIGFEVVSVGMYDFPTFPYAEAESGSPGGRNVASACKAAYALSGIACKAYQDEERSQIGIKRGFPSSSQ